MTLQEPRLAAVLRRLHQEAAQDAGRWEARRAAQAAGRLPSDEGLVRMGEFYLAVSPDEGRLLYLLARATRARHLVEFGASYGVSTLYLAAAARDGGVHLRLHLRGLRRHRAHARFLGLQGAFDVVELRLQVVPLGVLFQLLLVVGGRAAGIYERGGERASAYEHARVAIVVQPQ